ncbi:MAG: MaoC family dehydratase N-terminal domain-containing protein [Gammaproteobacteria bacterium]|nr:MaoC family dehydratase N-terminal domain-containing protein [Gammaproteobacteria bacterium]
MSSTSSSDVAQTLVTQEMIDSKGVWGDEKVSFPVGASDIRRWAIAVYWPEPPPRIYWDEAYARGTRWGGIIAPQEFNPFTWPVERSGPASAGALPGQAPKKGDNVLNGGQTDTFFKPIRPGDVITSRSRLSHWEERTGRNGLTLFQYTETEWRNQAGELVKRRMSTRVRY